MITEFLFLAILVNMKKVIHIVNINDFFPELFRLTHPTITHYAKKYDYTINLITERKFSDYPIHYEKLQVYEDGKENDINVLLDADMLIRPDMPDFMQICKQDHVAYNDGYHISTRFYTDRIKYFLRDGRDLGVATSCVVSSQLTHDLWEPIDLTTQQITELAIPKKSDPEWERGCAHYIDEFALSYNIAKYGLKIHGICAEDWQRPYLCHVGTGDKEKSIKLAQKFISDWF